MSAAARARRSESFAVRRWLQLGVASAGMGAALWGLSLAGPQVGTATADTGGASSASASASRSDGAKSVRSVRTARTARTATAPRNSARHAEDAEDAEDVEETEEAEEADQDKRDPAEPDTAASDSVEQSSTASPTPDANLSSTPGPAVPTQSANSTAVQPVSTPPPTPSLTASWQSAYSRWVARSLDAWSNDSLGWIESLQTDERTKAQLEAAFFTIRRTFFNQAPTIDPVQITGVLDGPVTGTLGAYDPDGDRMIYVLTRGPKSGSVHISGDGTFTYTPGTGFDGVDTFRVTAIDIGFHTNLLEPLRPIGSNPTRSLINQGAVKFDFDYVEGAEHWTAERRAELQRSADALILYFRVFNPVLLTYSVKGDNNPDSRTLASAGSSLLSENPGYWNTVVQHKLLTGRDANGAGVDGEINWNFGAPWGLGDDVAAGAYDFQSTAMHELLHSFGFMSMIGGPGDNEDRHWLTTDRFLVTANGKRPIGRDYRWDDDFDGHLVGQDGGLYFGGKNAVAAYGGPVPLFTPDPWSDGSSGSHTDDVTFAGDQQLLMNARTDSGLGVRVLSAMEIGVLRDLGYRVVDISR
ncbi:Ig-like domain-containing protein [Mycobacterium sp. C31M]